jgi:hypothetical protein
MRMAQLFLSAALVGCTNASDVAPRPVVGEVTVNGESFPIISARTGGSVWWVRSKDRIVQCSKPTVEACTWSLRHYHTSQDLMDDLGG